MFYQYKKTNSAASKVITTCSCSASFLDVLPDAAFIVVKPIHYRENFNDKHKNFEKNLNTWKGERKENVVVKQTILITGALDR